MADVDFKVKVTEDSSALANASKNLKGIEKAFASVSKTASAVSGSAFGQAFGKLLSFGAGLGGVALGLGAMGVKFGLDAANFKAETIQAFEFIEGSTAQATATYERIKQIADTTPFTKEAIVGIFQGLRGAGLGQDVAETVAVAMTDAAAVQGKNREQALEQLNNAFLKLNSSGKLTGETLQQYGEAIKGSGGTAALLKQLAKDRGKSVDQIKKDVEAGKISSKDFVDSFNTFVETQIDKGGGLGTATKKFGLSSWTGQISSLKANFSNLFENIDVSKFTEVLTNVNKAFGSPAAKAFATTINEMMDDLVFGLGYIDEGTLVSTFEAINSVVKVTYQIFKVAFKSIWEGLKGSLGPAMELFGRFKGGGASTEILWQGLSSLGKIVGYVAGAFLLAAGAITVAVGYTAAILAIGFEAMGHGVLAAVDWIVDSIGGLVNYFTTTPWSQMGIDLVKGFWTGLKATFLLMIGDWSGLIEMLPASVKKIMQIASPSRRMKKLGKNTGEGYVEGVVEEVNPETLATKFVPDSLAIRGGASATMGGAFPGGSTSSSSGSPQNIITITINLDGAGGSPEQNADAIARRLGQVFRTEAIQFGALT